MLIKMIQWRLQEWGKHETLNMAEWCGKFPRGLIMEIQARRTMADPYIAQRTHGSRMNLCQLNRHTKPGLTRYIEYNSATENVACAGIFWLRIYWSSSILSNLKEAFFFEKIPLLLLSFWSNKLCIDVYCFFSYFFYITTFFWQSSPQGKWSPCVLPRQWQSNKRRCRIHHISQLLPEGLLDAATTEKNKKQHKKSSWFYSRQMTRRVHLKFKC